MRDMICDVTSVTVPEPRSCELGQTWVKYFLAFHCISSPWKAI